MQFCRCVGIALLLFVGALGPAVAQTFPAKTIRLILPFPPGGPSDILGRAMAQKLTELQDLVALAKSNTAGLDIGRIPYGGAGPAVAAVVGNQIQIGCTALPPTTPHIQAGRLRALALTSAKRSSALPNVPTMAEAGFKDQEADTLQAVLLPAGTAKAIVAKIHADIVKILAQPDVKERVVGLGFDIVASNPEQFTAQIKTEIAKWGKVIRTAGLKVD